MNTPTTGRSSERKGLGMAEARIRELREELRGRSLREIDLVAVEEEIGAVLCGVGREESTEMLRELGGIAVSAATQHRLPQAVMARYETRRDEIERRVREQHRVPIAATTMQVGLDGVMVPQEGEHAKPRGREPEG